MTKTLDKQALLEWLMMQEIGEIEELEIDRAGAYRNVYDEIESGRFDIEEEQTNE